MHSKSDIQGYLKDKKHEIFGGLCPLGATPPPPALRIYFFPDSRFTCGGMSDSLFLSYYTMVQMI